MCGFILPPGAARKRRPSLRWPLRGEKSRGETTEVESLTPTLEHVTPDVAQPIPEVVVYVLGERRSNLAFWLTAAVTLLLFFFGWGWFRDQGPTVMAALIPTVTPIPPTPTYTPTWTPLPTDTPPPSETPTVTPVPAPSSTPRPPRFHMVSANDTLFGLSLIYRVSADSIAATNGFALDTPIQAGQSLEIPWPTATPPLESVLIDVNGATVMADAENCEIVEIQSGDSAYALSAARGVPLEAIIRINRHTAESIQLLQPGDTLCIPKIVFTDQLPPTPGPSPTPPPTSLPEGPSLLYPARDALIDQSLEPILLQWTAVKDLAENEWYMVELSDEDEPDSLPYRGFTRDTTFRLPEEWRPDVAEPHQMRWRVSIVQVTGRRSDGGFIYTVGGRASADEFFTWLGAVPTPTPTATPTATATPVGE
jgi:LysM repeat protein